MIEDWEIVGTNLKAQQFEKISPTEEIDKTNLKS